MDSLTKPSEIQKVKEDLRQNDLQFATFYSGRNAAFKEKAIQFVADNWNAPFVDMAFGKIYTFGSDSIGSLKSLRITETQAVAFGCPQIC